MIFKKIGRTLQQADMSQQGISTKYYLLIKSVDYIYTSHYNKLVIIIKIKYQFYLT